MARTGLEDPTSTRGTIPSASSHVLSLAGRNRNKHAKVPLDDIGGARGEWKGIICETGVQLNT